MKRQTKRQSTTTYAIPGHQPSTEAIRARAYELYQARGCQPGHAIDDWIQAEYELRQLPIQKLVEAEHTGPVQLPASPLVSLVQLALLIAGGAQLACYK